MLKPPPVPMPGIGGGGMTMIKASSMLESRLRNSAVMTSAVSPFLARTSGSSNTGNSAGQLHGYDDIAAILRRNKALRRRGEQPAGAPDQHYIDQQHHHAVPDHETREAAIDIRQPVEAAVEDTGEPLPAAPDQVPRGCGPLLPMRYKDLRGERWRERQRTEAGDRGRHRNCDRELLEELP